jgi:glycosyltransferase involved in cell wall biosynthesis
MKIAIVTPEFAHDQDGGLANYSYRIAKYLQEFGNEVLVILLGVEEKKFNYKGVQVHQFDFILEPGDRTIIERLLRKPKKVSRYDILEQRSICVNRKLGELQKNENFDIVHYAHLGGMGKYRLKNVPSVIRLSSSTRLCYEQGGYGESHKDMLEQEQIENTAMINVDGVFGPSERIAGYVSNQISKNVTVIETPFKRPDPSVKNESISDRPIWGEKYVLFFGSLVKLKGVEVLADILDDFLNTHPDLHFVMAGKSLKRNDGGQMADYIISKVENSDRLHLTGAMDQEELIPLIDSSSFVVLPSLIDNFPNTCIEAMNASKLVIGTIENGFEQLIDHDDSGYLVSPGNPMELLSAMNKAAALPLDEINAIGVKAKAKVGLLDPKYKVKELVDWYESIVKSF